MCCKRTSFTIREVSLIFLIFTTSNNNYSQANNFQRIKYKLTLNNGEYHISGESVYKDSQNLMPINFVLEYKDYIDQKHNSGKKVCTMTRIISYNFR
jgi:hypothetical protein